MKKSYTAVEMARSTFNTGHWQAIVVFAALAANGIIFLLIHNMGPHEATQRNLETGIVTMAVLLIAFSAFNMTYTQLQMMMVQTMQAEELANRKDEALISAIEILTLELKRRPAPNPAAIHLSLFGVKK